MGQFIIIVSRLNVFFADQKYFHISLQLPLGALGIIILPPNKIEPIGSINRFDTTQSISSRLTILTVETLCLPKTGRLGPRWADSGISSESSSTRGDQEKTFPHTRNSPSSATSLWIRRSLRVPVRSLNDVAYQKRPPIPTAQKGIWRFDTRHR